MLKENRVTDQTSNIPTAGAAAPLTDMPQHWWLDRLLPPFAREWARLGRWDRPVGVWLLYWPCAWGLMLAPRFHTLPLHQQFYWLGLFLLGSFVMRGAGCTINDMWDRRLDARVARTANRPLAAGRASLFSAGVFLGLQLAAGLFVLWQLPTLAQIVALLYVPLIILYPLMKRLTAWPQAFLAIVFSAGALIGWLTTGSAPTWLTGVLYLTSMAWVLAYDTVYAHMDVTDDALVGINSTVISLGERAVDLVVVCFWVVFFSWGVIAIANGFPALGWIALIIAIFFQIIRCVAWNPDKDANTLSYFQSQRWFGGMLALACWYDVLQHLPTHG